MFRHVVQELGAGRTHAMEADAVRQRPWHQGGAPLQELDRRQLEPGAAVAPARPAREGLIGKPTPSGLPETHGLPSAACSVGLASFLGETG